MSDRLPGSSPHNPIWHRGFAIWSATDDHDRHIFIWCHEQAELEDLYDRRHGDAPSLHEARAAIDNFLNDQGEIAMQRSRNVVSLADFSAALEAAGSGAIK